MGRFLAFFLYDVETLTNRYETGAQTSFDPFTGEAILPAFSLPSARIEQLCVPSCSPEFSSPFDIDAVPADCPSSDFPFIAERIYGRAGYAYTRRLLADFFAWQRIVSIFLYDRREKISPRLPASGK
ncbi:hypothetical protein [Desulfopila aestuarii]|uniref:Uncharacterized protein n=1 Tax=Desulfopila aestuarii DSM 18488 TaxID=1121416 RepID=A0A1M7XWT8_9BACT|nr:hypothetical protein [Desulfopila aestuarii]SHO43111.1 hypothetical protein SAMN02745220_00300 [Desulfopila aestuarii DSM 18488]